MDQKTFAGKFLSRLDKIDQQQIEAYLSSLIQAREFFEVIFNRMLEGIIVTDLDLRVLFMNTAAYHALGLKKGPAQYAGRSLPDLIKNPYLRERILEYNPMLASRSSEEIQVSHPKGRILQIRFLPIADDKGGVKSIVFLLLDITEQKKAQYLSTQKQHLTALAALLGGVAHEIKNPLNALQIHAHLLKKYLHAPPEKTTAEYRERSLRSMDIILEEISRLSRTVNEFLMTVRPQRIALEPGDVQEILRRLVEIISPTLEEKGIKLILDLESTKTEVNINKERLYQAFWNIAKNAEEALARTRDPEFRIASRIEGNHLAIDFIDNGCGIPEKDLDKIFEPYFTTKFSGSGRGLTVAYNIMNDHGGTLDIKSAEGKGTKVTIMLPLSHKPVRLLTDQKKDNEEQNSHR